MLSGKFLRKTNENIDTLLPVEFHHRHKLQGRGEKNNSRNIPIFFEDKGSLSIKLEMKWQMIMGFPILGVF